MADRPNLLFIFTDEQAINTIGAYGNPLIDTPNLDRLASESILFRRAYVTQPVCTPSRSSIMTGQYPHTNGCIRNNVPLREETQCLPEIGDWSDYETGYFGKWHLGDEVFRQHGFDQWRSTEEYYAHFTEGRDKSARSDYADWLDSLGYEANGTNDAGTPVYSRGFAARLPEEHGKPAFLGNEACRFLKENTDRPFALYVNFLEPHMPFFGPRDDQYDPEDIPLPESLHAQHEGLMPLRYRVKRRGSSGNGSRTDQEWRELIARYWGLASLVDTHVGRILDALRESGQYDNTIIVFTSDHGDMMGAHGMVAKGVFYEEATRVPLMVRIPGLAGGVEVDRPVGQIDLLPTLLDAMGRERPQHLEGTSLLPFLQCKGELPEEDVFMEWNGLNGKMAEPDWREKAPDYWHEFGDIDDVIAAHDVWVRAIVTPDLWKYCWSSNGEDELYHLAHDPHELRNLAADARQRERIADLRDRIRRWQERTGDDVELPEAFLEEGA